MSTAVFNPFSNNYKAETDQALIDQAMQGSKKALEALIGRHQHYIYNVALKMVLNPFDAEDLTQEVLIKVFTKLGQFQGKSSFRTWLYRITFNHFLKMKEHPLEKAISSFEEYGEDLDKMQDHTYTKEEEIAHKELIKEAQFTCMSGMLLCLSREQRLVYILGELFEVNHTLGSELLDITKANFRKRLERARKDLYQFMNNKCGLINKANPCRCARKTRAFQQLGYIDPDRLKFNTAYVQKINAVVDQKLVDLQTLVEGKYQALFQDLPFQEKDHVEALMRSILNDQKVSKIFSLN